VTFSPEAEASLLRFLPLLKFYDKIGDLKAIITEMAQQDPRPQHYKQGKYGEIFGFCVDKLNVLCKFGPSGTCEIVEIEDWSQHPSIIAAYPS